MRVQVTKRLDRGKWAVRWREGNQRPNRSFERKADAEAFAKAIERRLSMGGVDPDAGAMSLAEFVEEYWRVYAIPNLSARTRTAYAGVWERHLRARIGALALRDVTPSVVENVRMDLHAAGVGDPTIIKALGFLQGVFKRAVVRGKVTANPVREVDKPRQVGVRRAVPLAPETVEAMRAHLSPRDSMLLTLLAYVGLRPEEAINAEVEHVNGTRLWVPARKVANHDRDVDLLPVAHADLRAWLLASGIRSGLIVPRPNGGAWTESDWRNWRVRVYKPAAAAVGVTGDLRPYRLRGSFASLLIYEGRSPTYVAEQLGHSLGVLSKHYAGVMARLESEPRVSADEAIRAARVNLLDSQRTPAAK